MLTHHDAATISRLRCAPRSRCGRWRNCAACAAIRQARIADVAERLGRLYPALVWTTLHPYHPGAAGAAQAKSEWARRHRPEAGLWTIEQSPTTKNLHINILHPEVELASLNHSARWQRAIEGSVRNVAAYISKPEQFPHGADTPARIYGTLGPLWHFLANERQAETVAAAAIETALDPAATLQRARIRAHIRGEPEPQTMEEYRAIAARYLPNIMSARNSTRRS
jgi:hypothetical protein